MTAVGWIGVDLDGTLARYDGWKGVEHIGEPIEPMMRRVRQWLAAGQEVRIFTARVFAPRVTSILLPSEDRQAAYDRCFQADRARTRIEDWTEHHFGVRLRVTCEKDYAMVQLWDDRAVRVIANQGDPCCFTEKTQICL